MSKARQKRLNAAKTWFHEQGFTEDSHIVKAYRKKFNVNKDCAMKELCMLGVLSKEKQASYEAQMKAKKAKRKRKKEKTECFALEQDNYFYYIAGYTSGGAPYGITWEEAREQGLIESENDDFEIM